MVRTGNHDIGPDESGGGRLYGIDGPESEQDPVTYMHDTAAEAGDEGVLRDTFSIDVLEAEETGVALDRAGGQEAELN